MPLALAGSVQDLQCDYLDLYLVYLHPLLLHLPWFQLQFNMCVDFFLGVLVFECLNNLSKSRYKNNQQSVTLWWIGVLKMQMHWPVALKKGAQGTAPEDFAPLDTKATWQAMEKCYEKGDKTKAIGISNFSVEKTKALLSYAKVVPAVNQVECHPMWQQKKLHDFLYSQGIHLTVSLLLY